MCVLELANFRDLLASVCVVAHTNVFCPRVCLVTGFDYIPFPVFNLSFCTFLESLKSTLILAGLCLENKKLCGGMSIKLNCTRIYIFIWYFTYSVSRSLIADKTSLVLQS
jgi:hypothetical protein